MFDPKRYIVQKIVWPKKCLVQILEPVHFLGKKMFVKKNWDQKIMSTKELWSALFCGSKTNLRQNFAQKI